MNLIELLQLIVKDPLAHAKWLNTLSYLENCGARKIASCEHPIFVKSEMLKHASEEFRHAYYLKQQIRKISTTPLCDYRLSYMLGGMKSRHYLALLDTRVCRYLRKISGDSMKQNAYILVTYAIENRAQALYPLYQKILKHTQSSVSVRSIVLEEDQHLKEMKEAIYRLPQGKELGQSACYLEDILFHEWIQEIQKDSKLNSHSCLINC